MFRCFRKSSKTHKTLDARELEIFERELEESATKAMPSLVDDSFAAGGPSYNDVNPVSQVVNGRGLAAIGLRRLWEPRSRWRPEDKSEL